jgi:hypothetical protein
MVSWHKPRPCEARRTRPDKDCLRKSARHHSCLVSSLV